MDLGLAGSITYTADRNNTLGRVIPRRDDAACGLQHTRLAPQCRLLSEHRW